MKLSKLEVKNFKRISNVEIPLADVNILVGANGSGKSSIIQAVHLACCVTRQADRVDSTKTSAVGVDELDYLPTDDYKTLGHQANWGNAAGSPASEVALYFEKPDGTTVEARSKLRSARNAGISITGSISNELSPLLRAKRKFFSAYIPGISGIPNREECKSKKVVQKACSFGDSNVILRNALLLLSRMSTTNVGKIEEWISQIIGPVRISISHVADTDLYIKCSITINGVMKPIELAGTGYLQLIQIFCYILIFEPGVLLIDEPDIHLHPQVQEKLVGVLASVAHERGMRILLTTHSPFIVRGSPSGTNVFWLKDGGIESSNRELVEAALGWGIFGKKIIVVSEDSKTGLLRRLISQWPELERSIGFLPGTGYSNLITPKQAEELSRTLGGKFKILVHRDRDSLTDAEVASITAQYEALSGDVSVWFPRESDVEAYFCQPSFIGALAGCSEVDAEAYVADVLTRNQVPIRQQFDAQRAAHNQELHRAGGSPTNDAVLSGFQARALRGAKGKFVFNQLKNAIPGNVFSEQSILAANLSGLLAIDLKQKVEGMLA